MTALSVAIYSAGSGGMLIEKALRHSGHRIVVFFDKDPNKIGSTVKGIPVESPDALTEIAYDKIIIATTSTYEQEVLTSLLKKGVSKDKIILRSLLMYSAGSIIKAAGHGNHIDMFASGISYHRHAILNNYSSYEIFNYARASLDLYYDYCIASEILKSDRTRVRFWLLGLTQYSLHYDMSLSATWPHVFSYKELFGYHNLSQERKNYYLDQYAFSDCSEFFSSETLLRLKELDYETMLEQCSTTVPPQQITDEAKRHAMADFNKNYPKTVEENKQILTDYVAMLKDHDITPILTVVPVPKTYVEYASPALRAEFIAFIKTITKRFNCHFVDGYALDGFDSDLFKDGSHLNVAGGKRFTEHVDRIVQAI